MKSMFKRFGAILMALAILFSLALSVSAATVPNATIDFTKSGSIDIYKYDLTRANTDDAAAGMIDSYVSTGVRDTALEAVLDDGTVNDLGNGEQSYGYAIKGVEFRYLRIGEIVTYSETEDNGVHTTVVLYKIDAERTDFLDAIGVDASDAYPIFTGFGEEGYFYLWSLQPEHLPAASDALAQRFGVGADDSEGAFLSQLRDAVLAQVKNYWENNSLDILRSVDNSLLSGYDESEIRSVFLTAAVESTAYLTEMRCGLRQSTGFDPAAFHRVTEFNTSPSIHALGKAINETGAQILRSIEAAVKAYERQKSAERSKYNERDEGHQLLREADGRERHDDSSGERSELSQGGRRLDSRSDFGTGGGAGRPSHLPLGEPEKGLSEGASSDHLYDHAPGGNPLEAHEGRERAGTGAQRANDPRNGEAAGRDRGAETDRPNEVGRLDEQHQGQRGGDHLRGADLRLSSQNQLQELAEALVRKLTEIL